MKLKFIHPSEQELTCIIHKLLGNYRQPELVSGSLTRGFRNEFGMTIIVNLLNTKNLITVISKFMN